MLSRRMSVHGLHIWQVHAFGDFGIGNCSCVSCLLLGASWIEKGLLFQIGAAYPKTRMLLQKREAETCQQFRHPGAPLRLLSPG